MTRPPRIDVPGGPGLPVGSATEAAAARTDAVMARLQRKTNEALFAMDAKLRASYADYDALVERVREAAASEDPQEAIAHLLADVQMKGGRDGQ